MAATKTSKDWRVDMPKTSGNEETKTRTPTKENQTPITEAGKTGVPKKGQTKTGK